MRTEQPNNQLNVLYRLRISVTFHVMCVNITFSSVCVAMWPPFGKELLIRLTICYFCILTICSVCYFPFWFGEQDLGSDCFRLWSCILITFILRSSFYDVQFPVTAKLICVFVFAYFAYAYFAYAKSRFSQDEAHLIVG